MKKVFVSYNLWSLLRCKLFVLFIVIINQAFSQDSIHLNFNIKNYRKTTKTIFIANAKNDSCLKLITSSTPIDKWSNWPEKADTMLLENFDVYLNNKPALDSITITFQEKSFVSNEDVGFRVIISSKMEDVFPILLKPNYEYIINGDMNKKFKLPPLNEREEPLWRNYTIYVEYKKIVK